MPTFIDKTPEGLEHWVDSNEDEETRNYVQQDIEPVLNYTAALRADNLTDAGIKKDMWHYAQIPNVVVLKLLHEYGVNVFDRNDYPKLFKLLNTEFAYLKTTNLRHSVKH